MGWGSGTADFPYLIDPFSAIQQHLRAKNPTVLIEGIFDDYAYSAIDKVAAQCDICLAFVVRTSLFQSEFDLIEFLSFQNSDSGEGYITVDGNMGDRNNLTLWHAGEELIRKVTGNCSNTVSSISLLPLSIADDSIEQIVVIHSVGPVDMSSFIDNPNISAIVWPGLPGQESGNSLRDVIFGVVNPSGRLVSLLFFFSFSYSS